MEKPSKPNDLTAELPQKHLECLHRLQADLAPQLSPFPEFNTTWNLLRFCRARNFDYKKTRHMIEAFLDFHKKHDYGWIASLDDSDLALITLNYAKGLYGFDYEGRVLEIDKVSMVLPEKFLGVVKEELIWAYLIRLFMFKIHIVFPVLSKIHSRRVDKVFYIADLKDVPVSKFFNGKVLSFLKKASQMTSDYYPELLGRSFIINSPLLFKGVWSIVKVWLDSRTRDKFSIESGPALEKLARYMDVGNLPESMGGKNAAPISFFEGPWKQELRDAVARKSFFLKDRSLEYEFFYTEAERAALASQKSLPRGWDEIKDPPKAFDRFDKNSYPLARGDHKAPPGYPEESLKKAR